MRAHACTDRSSVTLITSNSRDNDAYSFTAHVNTSRTDTHKGQNQVTASGAATVIRDAGGNTNAIGTTRYAYTSENRLAAAGPTLFYNDPLRRRAHRLLPFGAGPC